MPARHDEQLESPSPEYFPLGQIVQSELPFVTVTLPLEHNRQTDEPTNENFPGTQSLHCSAVFKFAAKVPAIHWSQLAAPVLENAPSGQEEQEPTPFAE